MKLTRRTFLSRTALAAATSSQALSPLLAAPARRSFKIAACDWSLGKTADPSALDLAKEIGLDGVQVSLGTEANDMHLRKPEVQQLYRTAMARTKVRISSLAIGELNRIPFKSDPRAMEWVGDSIEVAYVLGRKVVLVPFFEKGDLKGDPAGLDEVVRRLKDLVPKADKAGVVLGLESWLGAEDHERIIDRVESKSVQVYYDVANSEKMGHDIYRDIRTLGKKGLICEFHMKENGALLGQGRVDFRRVREAIDDIGYSGWLVIEGAQPPGTALVPAYTGNQKFLRTLFPA